MFHYKPSIFWGTQTPISEQGVFFDLQVRHFSDKPRLPWSDRTGWVAMLVSLPNPLQRIGSYPCALRHASPTLTMITPQMPVASWRLGASREKRWRNKFSLQILQRLLQLRHVYPFLRWASAGTEPVAERPLQAANASATSKSFSQPEDRVLWAHPSVHFLWISMGFSDCHDMEMGESRKLIMFWRFHDPKCPNIRQNARHLLSWVLSSSQEPMFLPIHCNSCEAAKVQSLQTWAGTKRNQLVMFWLTWRSWRIKSMRSVNSIVQSFS